jgi:thymidylate synthase (FAD)
VLNLVLSPSTSLGINSAEGPVLSPVERVEGQSRRVEGLSKGADSPRRNNVKVELIAVTKYLRGNGTPEELLEHAGRVCYRSEKRGEAGSFLQARIREGHGSIIEHASATFEISGISRACSHQLVRHRIASYSQESQRYVDLSDPEFVVPPSVAKSPEAMRMWDKLTGRMRDAYQDLRRLGIRKEDSRFLLPHATATRIVVTMNFRELRHFPLSLLVVCQIHCQRRHRPGGLRRGLPRSPGQGGPVRHPGRVDKRLTSRGMNHGCY